MPPLIISPLFSDDRLDAISTGAFGDEREIVQQLLEGLTGVDAKREAIAARATALVTRIREMRGKGVEAFLNTYGLDTREGIAMMCLAEALLRIPDSATADQLIHSTFEDTQWSRYLGNSDSFFVNASSWGLLLTGSLVHMGEESKEKPAKLLGKLAHKMGEPVVREALKAAMRFIGTQFVLGETIEEALSKAKEDQKKGYRYSYDILGEGARTALQAESYAAAYRHAVKAIGAKHKAASLMEAPGISIKLSALHPRYQLLKEERVMRELLPVARDIVKLAMEAGISVSIDAEESTRLDIELIIYSALLRDPMFAGYDGIGFVLQAYQKRALKVLDYLVELCRETGRRIPLRLVKGAYWDSEIKQAQILGLPSYPVFSRKEHTDVSYLACAKKILEHSDCFYPQFATHNALTVAAIQEMAGGAVFEFQRLHGMGEALHDQLVLSNPCRIYAPVGRHEDLLAYLIRRLLENGANSSFVHLLMDKETPLAELLEDPIMQARENGNMIANPATLYSDRPNSHGLDMGNRSMLRGLLQQMALLPENREQVGEASSEQVNLALNTSVAAYAAWQASSVAYRAAIIERTAELLEQHKADIISLLMQEAGKVLGDGIGELREAIDSCYYYAAQARKLMGAETALESPTGEHNTLRLSGRGVFICISPWNFPLSIFMGQVVAALVTGNTVIAKPAQQTARIAAFAVKLLHAAGVPVEVVQLVAGDGKTIGGMLTRDERIGGVVFTGSMETARIINRSLAARSGPIVPLIAETGGQNCMVVDSSALLEQVCDDVIVSAFGSAGQRCSALRVLYVQEEIADKLIALITGAMQELQVGDVHQLATDIGAVIDAQARETLLTHIEKMKMQGKLLAVTPCSADGNYVAPHAFEIASIRELSREVFGPVLHIIRYKAAQREQVVEEINSTGYGLTFGVQSRIEENTTWFASRIHAGNIYINRSMIGATVGVQPFGGEGLSGTGPKAGGPHYLLRFVSERVVTVNSAAIGGNVELLGKMR